MENLIVRLTFTLQQWHEDDSHLLLIHPASLPCNKSQTQLWQKSVQNTLFCGKSET